MKRVLCLIDGFNYYHRIDDYYKDTDRNYKWLDYRSLMDKCLGNTPLHFDGMRADLSLEEAYFFTAIDKQQDSLKKERHELYVKALQYRGVKVVKGDFKYTPVTCRRCKSSWEKASEKKTDVNIAVKMTEAAFLDQYDVCFLFTGDTDQIPAIKSVRDNFPNKRIVVFQPPDYRFKDNNGNRPGHNLRIKREFKQLPGVIHKVLSFNDFRDNQLPNSLEEHNSGELILNPYMENSKFSQALTRL